MNSRLIIAGLIVFAFPGITRSTPEISNHETGSTIRYPVALLRGSCSGETKEISATNLTSIREDTRTITGAAHEGRFKVLAELVPGENEIEVSDGTGATAKITLTYEPQTNPHYVRVIWMTDRDGDTDYATDQEDDPQNYADKLDAAAKLMQTFTAERMNDIGYGRRTFRLEMDDTTGRVKVHTLAAPEPASHYHQLEGGPWYGEIRKWLNEEYPDPLAKNLVVAAYTRKDPETGKMLAHTALGGGNLGLFGGASVFTWPDSLDDIVPAFLDDTRVDPKHVHDDGNGRHTYWGVASTTIGAYLHEMGHTFGLAHCKDRFGIMTRGFDFLNRAFTFYDPASGRNAEPYPFKEEEVAYFAPISASFVQWSPWLQLDPPLIEDKARPVIRYDEKTGTFQLQSTHPIRWIGYWSGDSLSNFREYRKDSAPKNLTLQRAEWQKELGVAILSRLTVMAENGIHTTYHLPEKKKE